MIDRIRESWLARVAARLVDWAQSWLVPALLRRRTFGAAVIASIWAVLYWGLFASDRYVSEAHVIIQRTDLSNGQGMDLFSSLLGSGGAGNRADQLLLRDHLLSVDMLKKLDAKLNLRAHYSDWYRDPISRMWFESAPLEWFYDHYRSRVGVEYDDYSGVLIIKAQGYEPQTAHAIASMLVQEGERHMNAMAHNLAREQVVFLEKQVAELKDLAIQANEAMLAFQNKKGMISPQGTVENLAGVINRLEAQITDLQTRRTAMLGYLMPDTPAIVEINQQISAIERQISVEKARLTSPKGKTLNTAVEEYQRLQMNAQLAQDLYKTALVALEKGRVEATRMLKQVSVLQAPPVPEYPIEPRRLYNTVVFILVTLLIAGVVHLIAAIIRDHKD